jgi:hypothetical protein
MARVFQPHAITYIVGIICFVVLFIVALVFIGLCGKNKCPGFCCCCFAGKGGKAMQTYSNNIYAELSVEDLKLEYGKTKTELQDLKIMIEKGMI